MGSESIRTVHIPPPSDLTDEELRSLYSWVDGIPLSRPKRNFTRDFGDGVMAAEILKLTVPKLVELHNYPPANSLQQKLVNWHTLNYKVLRKIGFYLPEDVLVSIVNNQPGVIESVLIQLQRHLSENNYDIHIPNQSFEQERVITSSLPKIDKKSNNSNTNKIGLKKSPVKQSNTSPKRDDPAGIPSIDYHVMAENYSNSFAESRFEEKDQIIQELQETVQILQVKINKLEQLVALKDKIIEDMKIRGSK